MIGDSAPLPWCASISSIGIKDNKYYDQSQLTFICGPSPSTGWVEVYKCMGVQP